MSVVDSKLREATARPAHDTPLLRHLSVEWAPHLAEIAAGAVQRELDGELPTHAVDLLKVIGFGALRVPVEYGGRGATLPEITQLWIDLAAADANLPQALRGHFALVEDRLWQHARGHDQRAWFERFAAGEIAGNAWSEVGSAIDTQRTTLTPLPDGDFRLDGEKYYTTGSIFAEWADVYVRLVNLDRPDEAADDYAIAIVDTRLPGVSVVDDWHGFGQRGTGSGTTTFDNVRVPAAHVLPFAERFPYQTALYQLNLLATLVGIGRAALTDVVTQVRRRTRNYSHANASRVRDDPQVLGRIGDIAASVYAAEATTLRAATALQEVSELPVHHRHDVTHAVEVAEIESAAAQVVVTESILRVTTDLFDALGASATATSLGLDRHWRNARTVSSHNPRILKSRVVGAHVVNGTPPPYAWAIGGTKRSMSWPGQS